MMLFGRRVHGQLAVAGRRRMAPSGCGKGGAAGKKSSSEGEIMGEGEEEVREEHQGEGAGVGGK